MDTEVLPTAPHAEPAPGPEPARSHQRANRHQTRIVHATRGRVRLKIPAAQNNPELLHQVKAAFEGHHGIDTVEVREASGSLVISYDPDHHPDLGGLFASLGKKTDSPIMLPPPTKVDEMTSTVEEEAEFLAEHSALARAVVDQVKALDLYVKRMTGNNLDLKILVPITLACITFMEIGALGPTPMWVTLTIFSINHFVALHARDTMVSQND